MRGFWASLAIGILLFVAGSAEAVSIKMGPEGMEDPAALYEPHLFDSHEVSDPFEVNILVQNINEMTGFDFTLEYDPAVLEATEFELGGFLTSTGREPLPASDNYNQINNSLGYLRYGVTSFGGSDGPSGDGLMGTISFNVKDPEEASNLIFSQLLISDSNGTIIAKNDFDEIFQAKVTQTHTIQTTVTGGGAVRYDDVGRKVSGQESRTVEAGTSKRYSVLPYSCYQTQSVLINGNAAAIQSSYDFTDIQEDIDFQVTFEKKTFEVVTAAEHGTISSNCSDAVACGNICQFTITPDSHYELKNVVVDGIPKGAINPYAIKVTRDLGIIAVFREADGDINGDETIDLNDLIVGLQILAGVEPAGELYEKAELDTDDNQRFGMEEVHYIFQRIEAEAEI